MKEYLVVFEAAGANYSAYVPDLPGCTTTGATLEDAERHIKQAIELYIDTLRERGDAVPEPTTQAKAVAVGV